jgi:peptidoglycan hydrolase CwlO-like protein
VSRKKKTLIVVLGMHRSGTSAITRGLEVLGIDLGHELMPPAPDNETGFFEDREINALNVELLRSLGHNWHTLGPIASRELTAPSLEPLRQRAMHVMRVKMRGRDIFGFKDPRLSRLLPFWKRVFQRSNLEARYVIAVRNPISVTRSLETRNHIAPEKSYYLWLEHVVSSVLDTKGSKRLVVDYDRLLDKPDSELERLAHALGLPLEARPDSVREYKEEYLNEQLRHTRFCLKDLKKEGDASWEVSEAFRVLSKLASDKSSLDTPAVRKAFEQFQAFLSSAAPAFRRIDKQETTLVSLQHTISERDSQLAFMDGVLTQRNNDIEAARDAASGYARELTALEGQIESLQTAARDIKNELEARSQQLQERDSRLAVLTNEFGAVSAEVEARKQELSASHEALNYLKEEIERFQSELTNRESVIESAHVSRKRLESILEDRSRQIDQLNGKIVELTDSLSAAGAQLKRREQEFIASRQTLDNVKDQLEERSNQLEQFRGEHNRLQSQLEGTQAELTNSERALERARHIREQLESALDEKSRHIDRLDANIARLTSELHEAVAVVETREKETKSYHATVERLKGEFEVKSSRLEAVTGENRSLRAQHQQALAKTVSLESQVHESQQVIEQLRQEVATLRRAIEHTTMGIVDIASSLEAAVERRILRSGH